jgi:hypothetical protein
MLNTPSKLLLLRYNSMSLVKFPISEGTLPINLLAANDKICSRLHLNRLEGIVPEKYLPKWKQIIKVALNGG